MASSHIVPTTLPGMVDSIRAFAVANAGFTNSAYTYTASNVRYSAVTRGGIVYAFANPTISLSYVDSTTSTEWPPSGAPTLLEMEDAPPNRCGVRLANALPINVYMFSTDNAVHCMLEVVAGAFAYLGFGELSTGKPFMQALCGDTSDPYATDFRGAAHLRPFDGLPFAGGDALQRYGHVRYPYNGKDFCTFGYGDEVYTELRGSAMFLSPETAWTMTVTPNDDTDTIVLEKIEVLLKRHMPLVSQTQFWNLLGEVPGMAMVNVRDYAPNDEALSGWYVFPLSAKGFSDMDYGIVDSENIGLAFKA